MKWRYYMSLLALLVILGLGVLFMMFTNYGDDVLYPPKTEKLTIKTTWNNVNVPEDEQVTLKMTLEKDYLLVDVEAKFYNDPELPDRISKPGTDDKLYNFEVVELFLLGPNEHYLEIELGPRGQYFVLELHGAGNATRYPIEIDRYDVTNDGTGRWSARAHISRNDLPNKIEKLNAFAIYGSNENRVYMSLYPAPFNSSQYPSPNFHRLELFKETDFFKN